MEEEEEATAWEGTAREREELSRVTLLCRQFLRSTTEGTERNDSLDQWTIHL